MMFSEFNIWPPDFDYQWRWPEWKLRQAILIFLGYQPRPADAESEAQDWDWEWNSFDYDDPARFFYALEMLEKDAKMLWGDAPAAPVTWIARLAAIASPDRRLIRFLSDRPTDTRAVAALIAIDEPMKLSETPAEKRARRNEWLDRFAAHAKSQGLKDKGFAALAEAENTDPKYFKRSV
jgi:hypothetical protein